MVTKTVWNITNWRCKLTIFPKTIIHLVYPQNFTWPLASISLEIDCNTQEKLETMFLQIFFFLGGGGGGGGAHYGLCENGEWQKN